MGPAAWFAVKVVLPLLFLSVLLMVWARSRPLR